MLGRSTRKKAEQIFFLLFSDFSEFFSERCDQKASDCHMVILPASWWSDAMFGML